MSAQEHALYRFADCELDPRERRLRAHGATVTLTPKVFDTLVLLVERAGHVVSKDELMAALWPRGFVHESNLTKHIWLIRRALGDGDGESRYVETVPKLGYRFVAPVQKLVGDEPLAPVDVLPAAPPHDEQPWRTSDDIDAMYARLGWLARLWHRFALPLSLAVSLLMLVGGMYAWHTWRGAHATTSVAADSGALAIVDFSNLAGSAKDAWLGPALQRMLATEVATGGKLHALSEELVRPARADLPSPGAGGYAPASLHALQQRLGAHYVLSGAYIVAGSPDQPHVRVDLIVQDTQSTTPVATLSREGAVNDLPALIAQMGGDLRARFGEHVDPGVLKQIAQAQPASAEVARHLGFAMQALAEHDAARARDELLQAIAQAPGYAPAYMHLARAWSMLGYRAKAIAAANLATQYASGLPAEVQLQIRAQQAALSGNSAQLATLRAELVSLRPHDPEVRLQWIGALTAAAQYPQAQAEITRARTLPELQGDPRVELAAAALESARDNDAGVIPHARLALQQARTRGAAGLVADAELRLGMALDANADAEPTLRAAAADFHRLGNPHGEAQAWQNLANLQASRNQYTAARETYQRAMTIYQGVGDLGGEAAIYDNLSNMLWRAGDRDGTEAALRQALAIARETGDAVREAWTLTGLATVLTDESASNEAVDMYREAIALDRKAGARAHLEFALATYADLLRVRGDLAGARDACTQAQAVDTQLDAASRTQAADFECAQIALDRGDVDTATASLKSIAEKAHASNDAFMLANAQLVLGQIAMGQNEWSVARDLLKQSASGWHAQQETTGEATAQALLALCHDELHDTTARDAAYARARTLRAGINQRQEAFLIDVALAEHDAAPASLKALAEDATRRQWLGLAFESRLAELRVLQRGVDSAATAAARKALVADAGKAGFGWVVARATLAADVAPPHASRP